MNFAKLLGIPFSQNTTGWLLRHTDLHILPSLKRDSCHHDFDTSLTHISPVQTDFTWRAILICDRDSPIFGGQKMGAVNGKTWKIYYRNKSLTKEKNHFFCYFLYCIKNSLPLLWLHFVNILRILKKNIFLANYRASSCLQKLLMTKYKCVNWKYLAGPYYAGPKGRYFSWYDV